MRLSSWLTATRILLAIALVVFVLGPELVTPDEAPPPIEVTLAP